MRASFERCRRSLTLVAVLSTLASSLGQSAGASPSHTSPDYLAPLVATSSDQRGEASIAAACDPTELTWHSIGRLRGGRYAAGGAVVPRGAVDAGREGLYVYGGLSVEPGRPVERAESTLMRLPLDGPPDANPLADIVSDIQGGLPNRWGMGSAFIAANGQRPSSLVFVGGSDTDPEPSSSPTPTTSPPRPTIIAAGSAKQPLYPNGALAGGEAAVSPYVEIDFPPGRLPQKPIRNVSIAPSLDHAFAYSMAGDTPLFIWHGGHRRADDRAALTERLIRRATLDVTGSPAVAADAPGPSARFGHTLVAMDPMPGADDPSGARSFLLFGGSPDGKAPVARTDLLWRIDVPLDLTSLPTFTGVALDAVARPPAPRFFHAAGWDPVRHWLVVYGGLISSGDSGGIGPDLTNDTWALDFTPGDPRWLPLPGARLDGRGYIRSTMVWDPDAERLLLFGGRREADTNATVFALTCKDTGAPPSPAPATATPVALPSSTLVPEPATPGAVPPTQTPISDPPGTAQSPTPTASQPFRARTVLLPALARNFEGLMDDSFKRCHVNPRYNDREPNNARIDVVDTSPLPESTTVCGWFPKWSTDDRDLYHIEIPTDRLVLVWLDALPPGVRWDLHLLDADGNLLACSDPWAGPDNVIGPATCGFHAGNEPNPGRLAKSVSAATGPGGTHYISVRHRFGRTDQPYSVRWHADPAIQSGSGR